MPNSGQYLEAVDSALNAPSSRVDTALNANCELSYMSITRTDHKLITGPVSMAVCASIAVLGSFAVTDPLMAIALGHSVMTQESTVDTP